MIKSMTGYGEAVAEGDGIAVKVRIKSLNARFFELRLNLPELLSELEPKITAIVKKSLSRGTITVWFDVVAADKTKLYDIEVDSGLVRGYVEALKGVLPMAKTFTLHDILAMPNVLSTKPREGLADELSGTVTTALSGAIEKLLSMRAVEGKALATDLSNRLNTISGLVKKLESRKDECRSRYFDTIKKRISEIIDRRVEVDEERILQEAAILSAKSDPTEEITRLKSHIEQLRELLSSDRSVGSKLKFLLQECNREADTIGSKGSDLETSNTVIAIKEELERIREQSYNVE